MNERQTHRVAAKRTEPAPNAPNQRQTHRTSAKRTASTSNAPRERQTHRASKKAHFRRSLASETQKMKSCANFQNEIKPTNLNIEFSRFVLGGPKQLRRRRNSCKWGAVGRDSLSENILHAIVFEMTSCSECVARSMQRRSNSYSRHAPDTTSQRQTHQASAQSRMHRTSAKRTKPAPNAPNQRQTHRTTAKRTKPAPNAPNQRQTHRADAKRTAPKKDLLEWAVDLTSCGAIHNLVISNL